MKSIIRCLCLYSNCLFPFLHKYTQKKEPTIVDSLYAGGEGGIRTLGRAIALHMISNHAP